jgi:sigma-B regulation protein RsbU (phosphoserine phosphatase)
VSGPESNVRAISHFRHELRTFLTAIIGYSEHLLETIAAADEGGSPGEPGSAQRPPSAPEMERELREMKAAGDAMLAQVNERLSADALADIGVDAVLPLLQELGAECLVPAGRIDPICAGLIPVAEREGLYTVIPILCRIQAAGVMLHNLLKGYSREVPARVLEQGLGIDLGEPGSGEPSEPVGLPHRGGRVLVADDNSINRDLLRQWLTRQGHEVEEATGGEEALALVRKNDYDLILLDLVMPDKNGLEVLETLKQEGRLGLVPVIMLSALDEIDSVARCIERGADDYVAKPFNMVLLRARIRASLELKWHRQRERAYLAMLKEYRERAGQGPSQP